MQRRFLLAAGAAALLAACERASDDPIVKEAETPAPPVPAEPVALDDITDRKWVLDQLTPSSDNAFDWSRLGINMRLMAAEKRGGGYSGCNTWSAPFRSDGPGKLSFGPALSTRMACADPPGVMSYETEFLAALDRVRGYARTEDHLILQLEGGGQMVMIRDNVSSG